MLSFIKQKFHNLISDKKFSEILTGSAWALGARVIATVLGLIVSIIIARAYGAEVLGIVAVLNSFLMLATIFTVLGTNTSILRLIPEYLAKYSPTAAFRVYRKTQYFVAVISVLTGALLFFGSGFIADKVFSKPNLQFYFALAAVFIVFYSLQQLNTSAVRGLRLIRAFALMELLPSLSKLIILVPLTLFFFHYGNPVYAAFASIAVTAIAGAWIMDRTFKQKTAPTDTPQSMPMKDILTLSLPMFMTSSMTFLMGQTGVIMLGMFRSEAEVGYFALAVKLATLTSFVLKAITTIALPKFSELFHSGKTEELFYVARKSSKLIFYTTAPILAFLVILGKPVIALFFGAEFVVIYPALLLLIAGQFVFSIAGAVGSLMNMIGDQTALRNIFFIGALLNVVLNFLLIPDFGIIGASIATMTSIVFWNLTALIYVKKKYGVFVAYSPFSES